MFSAPALLDFETVISGSLLPWTEQFHTTNVLVLPVGKSPLPAGISVSPRPIVGPRVRQKNYRPANQISVNRDTWPESDLCTKAAPLMMWVLSGQADIHIGAQNIHCRESHVLLIPAGVPHPMGNLPYVNDGSTNAILLMRVTGRGFRTYITHTHNRRILPPRPGESLFFTNEDVVSLFQSLCEALIDGQRGRYAFHSMMHFILTLQREILLGRAFNIAVAENHQPFGISSLSRESSPVETAKNYMTSHLGDDLTIEHVARRVHMSRSNFARVFRAETGQTFLEFLHDRRLEKAQAVLKETDWTVRSVSELCGFGSCSSFNRLFSARLKMTPLEYRKQHRNTGAQIVDV